jgi:hypothetical protein
MVTSLMPTIISNLQDGALSAQKSFLSLMYDDRFKIETVNNYSPGCWARVTGYLIDECFTECCAKVTFSVRVSKHADNYYQNINNYDFSDWDSLNIITAWSNFEYTLFKSGSLQYKGAYHGFLKQNLIPDFDVDIMSAKAKGSMMLDYVSLEHYVNVVRPIVKACKEQVNLSCYGKRFEYA